MQEKMKPTLGVKIAIGIFASLATIVIIALIIVGYHMYKVHQEAEELKLLTEKHIANKYPDAEILEVEADTKLLGERLAHVVFNDEPNSTYSYGLSTTGIIQIKPNPPEDEKSQYKYLE